MKNSHIHLTRHRLSRPIRLTIMISLIASFFIASPIMILYIAGFRYDFEAHRIRQTGVLSVDIEPKQAEVWLNDILIEKNIPIRLANRAPGTYDLSIEHPGFKPWHEDITIESNQTTYVNDIILIREPVPIATKTQFDNIIGIYGTQKSDTPIIMTHDNGVYEIVKYDLSKDSTIPLLRTTSIDTPAISISPYRDLAMIHVMHGPEDTVHIIPLDTTESITTFNLPTIDTIHWYDNWFEPLVVHVDDDIITLSPNKNQNTIHQTTAAIWYIDNDGTLWTYEDGSLSHLGSQDTYTVDTLDTIVHINHDRIVTHAQDMVTIIHRQDDRVETMAATNYYYNDDNKQLLVWTPWEVSVIYEDGTTNLISRSGDDIQDIHIFDEHNTLLFMTKNGIKTFDPRYYVGYDVFSHEIDHLFAATKKRELIYLNPHDDKLYRSAF